MAATHLPDNQQSQDHSDYYGNCRFDVIELLPDTLGQVLDVGCGSGVTGQELLRTGRATIVDGIELDPGAARRAREHYRTVYEQDLDSLDQSEVDGPYDTLMCNDVLEHLQDPWSVLAALVTRVRRGGTVVVSLPNVQCAEVVFPLLRGRFDYTDDGVLDRTHLRFFTRDTGRALVESAGLEIVDEASSRLGMSKGALHQVLGLGLGPFGVRQLLYLARRP